jgi:hypothetical protein
VDFFDSAFSLRHSTTNFVGGIDIVWGLRPHAPPPTKVGGLALLFNYFNVYDAVMISMPGDGGGDEKKEQVQPPVDSEFQPSPAPVSSPVSPVNALLSGKTGADAKVGGIDLSRDKLELQIKRDGQGMPLPVHLQDVERILIDGFVPIIINIAPMNDLPLLLGLDTVKEDSGDIFEESSL